LTLRAWIEDDILYLHPDDTPAYKKQGSIVRNSFFWALRSIAANSAMGKAWEFETAVWFALQRMLLSFTDAGYLSTRETQLEFREDTVIPTLLQTAALWISAGEFDPEPTEQPVGFSRDRPAPHNAKEAAPWDSPARKTRRKSSFRRKAKPRPEPEPRPAPPYSSYIKKQP